jgi:putative ABC transport system ATP-binding protein
MVCDTIMMEKVLIDQKDIRSFSLHTWIELRKTKLSVIFQDLQLFGDLTTWENLQLKNSLTNHRTDIEINEMLEILGIPDKKNQTAKTLSLGTTATRCYYSRIAATI